MTELRGNEQKIQPNLESPPFLESVKNQNIEQEGIRFILPDTNAILEVCAGIHRTIN